jgi:hypothetical protein
MIPKIDEVITTQRALDLCNHYGFEHLVKRIEENHEAFIDWVFDGASMIPDDLFPQATNIPNLTEIALKHDLKFAYGALGNKEEKSDADKVFKEELLKTALPKKLRSSCSKLSTFSVTGF